MKDKIELTRSAFERWCNTEWTDDIKKEWQALCAEAEKKEPVVFYAILDKNTNTPAFTCSTMSEALTELEERFICKDDYRIIRLVEEVSK